MEKIPVYSVDLIKELDKLYPERSPEPSQSDREIWMAVGARRLVRALIAKVKADETEEMNQINVFEKE